MKKSVFVIYLSAVAIIVLAVIMGCFVIFFTSQPSIMEAGVIITSSRLELQEAREKCPISLPDSASGIQYGIWSHWQSSMTYVRFKAPVLDCLEHVERVLYEVAETYSIENTSIVSSTNFPAPESPYGSDEFDISWFDVENLSNGTKFELDPWPRGGGSPVIYIDQNRGIFYYRHFD